MLFVAHVAAAAVFEVVIRIMVWRGGFSIRWFDFGIRLLPFGDPWLVWLTRPLVAIPMAIIVDPKFHERWLLVLTLAAYLIPFIVTYSALSLAWRRRFKFAKGCCPICGYDLRHA